MTMAMLLGLGFVNAQTANVSTGVTITILGDGVYLQTEGGTINYSLSVDLMNSSKNYLYQFPYNFPCAEVDLNSNLANYTTQIVSACKINLERELNCQHIFETNTQQSYELLNLRQIEQACNSTMQENILYKDQVNSLQENNKGYKDQADKVPGLESQRYNYFLIGAFLGAIAYWFFVVRKSKSESRAGAYRGREVNEGQQKGYSDRVEEKLKELGKEK